MIGYDHANYWRLKNAIRQITTIGILLVAIGALSGCGGYHKPMGTTMPGRTPRPYPMQHPKAK
jgi:hypothetical protein